MLDLSIDDHVNLVAYTSLFSLSDVSKSLLKKWMLEQSDLDLAKSLVQFS
jgi:hypothetical protein